MAKSKSQKATGVRSKTVYNMATGKHEKPGQRMDTTAWWMEKMGFGGRKPGKGALAKRRRATVDSHLERAQ